MQVSFTGIKNAGFICMDNGLDEEFTILNTQLTDDCKGKELTEYKNLMARLGNKIDYSNPVRPDFFNVIIHRKILGENTLLGGNDVYYELFLNGKKFGRNDSKLPLFDFIAKISKTLMAQKNKDFVVNEDYLSGDDCRFGMFPYNDAKSLVSTTRNSSIPYDVFMKVAHTPYQVKEGAEVLNDIVDSLMVDYFA